MSERLPSHEEAICFLIQSGCRQNVVNHCEVVSALAVEMAEAAKTNGFDVDLQLVEVGALLHDIGRARTHSVQHAIAGAEIAESLGLPRSIIQIIERHVGGGISAREAKNLGWPKGIYTPQTLEEKIISYADKLIEGSRRVPFEKTLQSYSKKLPHTAIERMMKIHQEMTRVIGDCTCLP